MKLNQDVERILIDLKIKLQEFYKQRFKGLLLFGSHARGEAVADSDIDVGLILDQFGAVEDEIKQSGEIVAGLSLQNNVVISLHPLRENDWRNKRIPFILNLKKEGINF